MQDDFFTNSTGLTPGARCPRAPPSVGWSQSWRHVAALQSRMRAIWVSLRVLLGLGGGYAASAAGSAALAVALYRLAGFDSGESTVLCTALGFAFYLFALLWALTAPSLVRVALMLACGAVVGYGVVHWLSPVAFSAPSPLGIGV